MVKYRIVTTNRNGHTSAGKPVYATLGAAEKMVPWLNERYAAIGCTHSVEAVEVGDPPQDAAQEQQHGK